MGSGEDRWLQAYALMWRIRLFEEKVLELFKAGHIRGTAHLSMGQEAVAVGACMALRQSDYVTSTHRGHGHCLAKGLDPAPMLAEIVGKATGYNKGKGGSMHVTWPPLGMLGADAVVGAGTPIATGAALGAKVLGKDAVALCFFGDGAANQGVLYESMNLAAILKLPVVYLCENNLWALSTPARYALCVPDVAARAEAFGAVGAVVDGQDVFAVHEAVSAAVERARAGGGPSLIEAKTYRYHTHSAFATREVRPPEEIAYWKARDPIVLLGQRLVAAGQATEARLEAIKAEEVARIQQAAEFALSSPRPDPAEAYTDVLADDPAPTGAGARG